MNLERKMFAVVESLRMQMRSKQVTLRSSPRLAKWKKETLRWAYQAQFNAVGEILAALKQHRLAKRQARLRCQAEGKRFREVSHKR